MSIHSLYVDLGGGTALHSPFQREHDLRSSSLPPLLRRHKGKRPATKGAYPLGSPDDLFSAASSSEQILGILYLSGELVKMICVSSQVS